MSSLDIWLLAVALAMDCFTVSIIIGVTEGKAGRERQPVPQLPYQVLRMALLFGLFQALMPLIGWFATSHFSEHLEAADHWIAFCLLTFIGGKMIRDSLNEEQHPTFNLSRWRTQLMLAVATSIDALAVGISFACIGYDTLTCLIMPLTVIGLVSFLFSLFGWRLGVRFGDAITRRLKPELFGGIILIVIGIKILVTHLLGMP